MIKRFKISEKNILSERGTGKRIEKIKRYSVKLTEEKGNGDGFRYIVNYSYKRLAIDKIIKGEKEWVYLCLKGTIDYMTAFFQQANSSIPHIKVNILDKEYVVPIDIDTYGADHQTWSEVLEIAILLRDEEVQKKLLELPIWEPEGLIDVYDLALAKYQKALLEGDEEGRKAVLEYVEEIKDSDEGIMNTIDGPVAIKSTLRSSYFTEFMLPVIRLFEYILSGKEEAFNTELENSILAKKKRIKERKDEDDSRDWINFQLLACCAYAHDKGIKITVESEYIPRYVYEADYPKELLDLSNIEI